MGYRIDFAVRDGALAAVVRGKSSPHQAAWIAHDIAEQAGRQAARRLLIDLRSLADRVGSLGTLLMAPAGPRSLERCKVAVLDVADNDAHYVFSEAAARACGYPLRFFDNPAAAFDWLGSRG